MENTKLSLEIGHLFNLRTKKKNISDEMRVSREFIMGQLQKRGLRELDTGAFLCKIGTQRILNLDFESAEMVLRDVLGKDQDEGYVQSIIANAQRLTPSGLAVHGPYDLRNKIRTEGMSVAETREIVPTIQIRRVI